MALLEVVQCVLYQQCMRLVESGGAEPLDIEGDYTILLLVF